MTRRVFPTQQEDWKEWVAMGRHESVEGFFEEFATRFPTPA